MTIRYDRDTRAAKRLTGGPYRVTFPRDTYELDLDDDVEADLVARYEAIECVDGPESDAERDDDKDVEMAAAAAVEEIDDPPADDEPED